MKKAYLLFIAIGLIVLGVKYFQNNEQNRTREVVLSNLVGRSDFQESIKKITLLPSNDSFKKAENEEQVSGTVAADVVQKFDWPMLDKFKADEKFKTNTENVLNIIKTQNDQRFEVYPVATIEMRNWISTLNKNPTLAKQTYNFLLSQPEIKSMEFLTAELIKVSKFINFDKQSIMKISERNIEEDLGEVTNVKDLSLEEYGHFMKVKESALFILDSFKVNQSLMEIAAKKIFLKNKHPLIEREIMSQLRYNYPNSKMRLTK